jgi:preprotein translocase subunit SecA
MARAMRESTNGGPASAGGTKPGFTPSGARIGRNDPCYCGSGLKYKKCHGR